MTGFLNTCLSYLLNQYYAYYVWFNKFSYFSNTNFLCFTVIFLHVEYIENNIIYYINLFMQFINLFPDDTDTV